MANLVPGAITIPAAVLEIVRLQEEGYKLVVNHSRARRRAEHLARFGGPFRLGCLRRYLNSDRVEAAGRAKQR
jgi:hypothetical protein